MKISFILPTLNFSGGVKVVKEYCTKLNEFGHDCQIWYPLAEWVKHCFTPDYEHSYIHTYVFPWQLPDADVVIATSWETAYIVNDLSSKKGKKFYFIQHYEQFDWFDGGEINLYVDETYDLPLTHIYVSEFIRKYCNVGNEYPKDSKVVHNGVNVPEVLHKDYSKPSILFPIRKLKWKGWSTLKPALERIHKEFPDVTIRCYGIDKPDDVNSFIEVYENCGQETVDWLMETSNIFVFPSEIEGFGLPALEAAAYGCAVISTKQNAMPEIFDNDMLWVENSDDIYQQLRRLILSETDRYDYAWRGSTSCMYTIYRAAREFEKAIGCNQP